MDDAPKVGEWFRVRVRRRLSRAGWLYETETVYPPAPAAYTADEAEFVLSVFRSRWLMSMNSPNRPGMSAPPELVPADPPAPRRPSGPRRRRRG